MGRQSEGKAFLLAEKLGREGRLHLFEPQQLSGLFSFTPTPHLLALKSALETLMRTRAPILCSPLFSREELGKIAALLLPIHYQCWVEYLEQREDGPMMLLALSGHIKLEGHNMKRIVLS